MVDMERFIAARNGWFSSDRSRLLHVRKSEPTFVGDSILLSSRLRVPKAGLDGKSRSTLEDDALPKRFDRTLTGDGALGGTRLRTLEYCCSALKIGMFIALRNR